MSKQLSSTVGFRLDSNNRSRLEHAADKNAMSPHEYARSVLVDHLNDSDVELDQLRMKLTSFENELFNLKRGLANAVEAILVVSGGVVKEEAKEWVNEHIRR